MYWKRKALLLYANENEVRALVRLAFYENLLVNGQESCVCCSHWRVSTLHLRGPIRASGGLRTSLIWISKPAVVLRIEEEAISLSQFQPIGFVSFVTISVPMSLFQGHVACQNFSTLTSWAPALTGPHFSVYECKGNVRAFPRDKENWPYHSDVKLLHCVNQVRPRCWKCWVHRIILRNFGGRIMNSFIVHVRLLSVGKEALLKLKKF